MINNVLPIVFCNGLQGVDNGGFRGYPYFVCAHGLKEIQGCGLLPFLLPPTVSVSSFPDNVCELFSQLKNGFTHALTVQFLCMFVNNTAPSRNRKYRKKKEMRFYANLVTHILYTRK